MMNINDDVLKIQKYLSMAVEQARKTMSNGEGGPFGAVIVDSEGNVFTASNQVLAGNDPTAHAEICAIRKACAQKKTHDLSGCVLYTTCYPCPMCLSAIIWANIKEVWYGSTAEDAAQIGFRDSYIYKFIGGGCKDSSVLNIRQSGRSVCEPLMDEYKKNQRELY